MGSLRESLRQAAGGAAGGLQLNTKVFRVKFHPAVWRQSEAQKPG